jgi:hypothetical protein
MSILEREREHIGSIWSRVACLALPLATTKSLECRALEDSQSLWHLTIATGNKQVETNTIHRYEHMGAPNST